MTRQKKSHPPRSARLFAEPHPPAPPTELYTAHIDGAARGNPGPASYGVVFHGPNGQPTGELKKYLGRMPNNCAEYHGLIAALDYAAAHQIRRLRVRSDSELMVRQLKGLYRVRSADLRPLYERAVKLINGLEHFEIEHIPREQNREADALANEALDRTGTRPAGEGRPKYFNGKQLTADDLEKEQKYRRSKSTKTSKVRAHYRNGVLVPVETLDLPEGAEVEISLPRPRRG